MEEAWVGEVDGRCCGRGGAGKAGGMCDINPLLNGEGGGKEIQHLWWVGMVGGVWRIPEKTFLLFSWELVALWVAWVHLESGGLRGILL